MPELLDPEPLLAGPSVLAMAAGDVDGPRIDPKLVAAQQAVVDSLRVCDVLHHSTNHLGQEYDKETDGPTPHRSKVTHFLTPYGVVRVEDGREVRYDWRVRPWVLADRMSRCSGDWITLARVNAKGEHEPIAAPAGCDCRWCPTCAHYKAASKAAAVAPLLEAMLAGGARAYHLTLTIPHDEVPRGPVVLTPAEQELYRATTPVLDEVGVSSVGPGLAQQLDTLLGQWAVLRDRGRGAKLWRRSVLAGLYRWEATGRRTLDEDEAAGGHRYVPRWHAHLHALVILRPEVEDEEVLERLLDTWCALVGGDRAAQHVRPIGGSGEALGAALREVIKYPVKPMELTMAQRLEAAGVCVGRHDGYVMGALHQSSKVYKGALEIVEKVWDWQRTHGVPGLDAQRRLLSTAGKEGDELFSVLIARALLEQPPAPMVLYRDLEPGEDAQGAHARITARASEDSSYGDSPISDDRPYAVGEPRQQLVPITWSWLKQALAEGRTELVVRYRVREGPPVLELAGLWQSRYDSVPRLVEWVRRAWTPADSA